MPYMRDIQGSPTNGTFTWINPHKYRNPTITSITILFFLYLLKFNNVNSTSVVTNTNGEERMIPLKYYTFGEIIAIFNTMIDATFSISTQATSYKCIWIQSPHTIDITKAWIFEKSSGLEGRTVIIPASFYESNVVEITRYCHVIHVYSLLVQSSHFKMSTTHQNNNLLSPWITDIPSTDYSRSMANICIPMITRFDRSIDQCLCSGTWKAISCY